MSFLLFFILLGATEDRSEMLRMLQYQFDLKLQDIRGENDKLKDQITELQVEIEKQSRTCEERVAAELQKQQQQKAENPLDFLNSTAESIAPTEDRNAYQTALVSVRQKDWDESLLRMEAFARNFPKSEFADNALYWLAQIYLKKNEIELARSELSRLISLYPESERAKHAQAHLMSLPLGERHVTNSK